ncbi:hypothetical protein [Flavobacterium phycosphaerae]|uniref:hypothetical protein n=1 Tax=Flavobacterium phycosphaerae TaxID=2697515 RepID=UPI00138A4F83|nr:hypothetical protein [Flavobacterium phycosphaerae]
MKTVHHLRKGLLLVMVMAFLSCSSGYYANHGTASDRTGTNGATNGTGKVPRGTSHRVNY